ncbi:MAG: hypothetical protein IPL43_04540 [Micropruina sp.]|nr:hypothetical protein [Micropruina sp.]
MNEMLVALRLPDVTPQFGPRPSVNEWGMLPVGHPIWLWTDGPRTRSASVASQGVTFRLSATWVSMRFSMGDGVTVTCTSMSKYTDAVVPGTRSPSCGHVYSMPSLPKGDYAVTATATWRINWSAAGVSGSFRHAYSDTAQLPIGELQGLIVR